MYVNILQMFKHVWAKNNNAILFTWIDVGLMKNERPLYCQYLNDFEAYYMGVDGTLDVRQTVFHPTRTVIGITMNSASFD